MPQLGIYDPPDRAFVVLVSNFQVTDPPQSSLPSSISSSLYSSTFLTGADTSRLLHYQVQQAIESLKSRECQPLRPWQLLLCSKNVDCNAQGLKAD